MITAVWKKETEIYTVDTAIKRLKKVMFAAKIGMDIHTEAGYFMLE